MEDLLQHTWMENCQVGAYLVNITPSASVYLSEQLRKYKAVPVDEASELFEQAIGTGSYGPVFQKLICLQRALEAKADNKYDAYKQYAYALRNMLMHSIYKPVIKYLEKPSTTPSDLGQYEADLTSLLSIDYMSLDAMSRLKYRLLYSFIKTILVANRFETKLTQNANPYEQAELFFEHLKENNDLVAYTTSFYRQQQAEVSHDANETFTYFATLVLAQNEADERSLADVVEQFKQAQHSLTAVQLLSWLQIYAEELAPPYLLKEKYRGLEQNLEAQGVQLHHLLQELILSYEDLHWLMRCTSVGKKPTKLVKELVAAIVQLAFIRHTKQLISLASSFETPVIAPTPAQQKAPQTEAPSKKELQDLKQQLRAAELEAKQAKDALEKAKLNFQQAELQLEAQQKQIDELQQKLKQEQQKPPITQQVVPAEAQQLTASLALMVEELKIALQMEEIEEVEQEAVADAPIEADILDRLSHLKIGIVGGHDKYRSRLKSIFPQELLTVSPDRLNGSPNQLLQCDVVVFITSYNNHSLYERYFDFMKRHDAKNRCLIINSQPNAKRLAEQIEEFTLGIK